MWEDRALTELKQGFSSESLNNELDRLPACLMKTRLVVLHCVNPVQDDHVEVDVKVQRTAFTSKHAMLKTQYPPLVPTVRKPL